MRDLWREIMTPSARDESAYLWILIAIGHAMLGASAISANYLAGMSADDHVRALVIARIGWAVAYWLIKERRDLRKGGTVRDGVTDSAFYEFGTLYVGPWWWPPAVMLAAGAGAIWRSRNA